MTTTLIELFKRTFHRNTLLAWAREHRAVQRLRQIHPQDFALAVVGCALGDEQRSIATARRLFNRLTGIMPEESSFYDRFSETMASFMQHLFQRALDACSMVRREAVAEMLGGTGILDLLAVDATQVLLPAAAGEALPSTNEEHGGFKLTATLSLLYQSIQRIAVTDARTHDRKGLQLARWLHGLLFLFDRGYSDHGLFKTIADRGGLFLSRLKESSVPAVATIRRGLGQVHLGSQLTGDLPYRGVVDLDAEFRLRKGGTATFRVIRVSVDHILRSGIKERVDIWLVTNLSPILFSAEQVALLYRMRWEIEILFRALKSVGRLDQLRTASIPVIRIFLYATLLGMVIAQDISAHMRRLRPEVEPSIQRVTMLVLGYLPLLADATGTRRLLEVVDAFEDALWREGVNPNPGRPYATTCYAGQVLRTA